MTACVRQPTQRRMSLSQCNNWRPGESAPGHSRLSSVRQCVRHVRYCSDSYQIGKRPHLQRRATNGIMHCSKSSHRGRVRTYYLFYLFALDLNGNAVVIGGARNDHQVATWDLVLAAHQLADRSDCINDGCTRRVGHETLKWL
jgi:hypothetical protein